MEHNKEHNSSMHIINGIFTFHLFTSALTLFLFGRFTTKLQHLYLVIRRMEQYKERNSSMHINKSYLPISFV